MKYNRYFLIGPAVAGIAGGLACAGGAGVWVILVAIGFFIGYTDGRTYNLQVNREVLERYEEPTSFDAPN